MPTPEAAARRNIDAALQSAGWHVQDFAELNLTAGFGVAVREFPLARGHGKADYALDVAGKLAGVVEAKKEGTLLTGIEVQSEKYAGGVPSGIPAHVVPLPFLYESTGVETQFTNRLDPEPRSRTTLPLAATTRTPRAGARGHQGSGQSSPRQECRWRTRRTRCLCRGTTGHTQSGIMSSSSGH